MARNTEDDVKSAKIKLSQPHNHAGVEYQPGDVLEMRDDQIEWMVKQGRGERVPKRERAVNDHASESAAQADAAEKQETAGE